MKNHERAFEPLTLLFNKLDDVLFRDGRTTIWGDLSPDEEGLEKADHAQVPYTYGLFIQSRDGRAVDGLEGGVGRMAGNPADRFGQLELRAAVDAFLIGGGTLRADRSIGAPLLPELVVRRKSEKGNVAPLNVFFSASGDFPKDLPVFQDEEIKTALFVTGAAAEKVDRLKELSDDVTVLNTESPLPEMWHELWRRGVVTVGFEGGPKLMGMALADRLVHELLITHSPLLLGGASPSFADTDKPLQGLRADRIFLGLDEPSQLLFERSRIIQE
jgi:riboflavin biosynthesis pyrimidine reductase